jgi:hypothetical protein
MGENGMGGARAQPRCADDLKPFLKGDGMARSSAALQPRKSDIFRQNFKNQIFLGETSKIRYFR